MYSIISYKYMQFRNEWGKGIMSYKNILYIFWENYSNFGGLKKIVYQILLHY